jgi:agmatine deiminase
MIGDSETNYLYLAGTLPTKFPEFAARFIRLLSAHKIAWEMLPHTKDVWAVDYMPIQTDLNRFVRFTYNPKYMQAKMYQKKKTDVDALCQLMGIETIPSGIILDGGNVIRSKNKVLMTDRIFRDNPGYERKQLIKELRELLEVDDLYFLPEQPGDFSGHADGMVRFIDEHTVMINDYSIEKEWFYHAFEIAIHNTGLDYVRIPYNVYDNASYNDANGDYINFLQMENTIILPTFGLKEDEAVVRQFEEIFPRYNIQTIESNDIARKGGILNCITWNIRVEQ